MQDKFTYLSCDSGLTDVDKAWCLSPQKSTLGHINGLKIGKQVFSVDSDAGIKAAGSPSVSKPTKFSRHGAQQAKTSRWVFSQDAK